MEAPEASMRSAVPIVFSILAASLAAQAPAAPALQRPLLDVLPAHTQGFLFARNPMLAQLKLKALLARFQRKEEDPLSALQKRFGLPALPNDRRGLAVALVSDESAHGGTAEVLFVPIAEFKDFLAPLKATRSGKQAYSYLVEKKSVLAGEKDGWAVLAAAEHRSAFRKALAPGPSVRPELGGWDTFIDGGDLSGMMTPRGIAAFVSEARRGMQQGRGAAQMEQVEQTFEGFLGQAEREVSHVAFRADTDADGNLVVSAKARLQPNGAWASLGKNIPAAEGLGLKGFGAGPWFLATGGGMPTAWVRALGEGGIGMLLGQLEAKGLEKADLEPIRAAIDRNFEHLQGFGMLVAAAPGQPMLPVLRYRMDDVRAYQADLEALARAINEACGRRKLGTPSSVRTGTVAGFPAFQSTHDLSALHKAPAQAGDDDEDDEDGPGPGGTLQQSFVALDGQDVFAAPLPLEAMEALVQAHPRAPEPLAADGGIAKVGRMLPERASLYAFVNPKAMADQFRAASESMKRMLPDDLKARYPELPPAPDCAPAGGALTFELDVWSLDFALPADTQLALGAAARQQEEIRAEQMKLFREHLERERQKTEAAPKK
jgi:hypothetical protein